MSMNNENLAPRWELGDAITIRLPEPEDTDDTDPDDTEASGPEDPAAVDEVGDPDADEPAP